MVRVEGLDEARDVDDVDATPAPLYSLYCGAGGVWLALVKKA